MKADLVQRSLTAAWKSIIRDHEKEERQRSWRPAKYSRAKGRLLKAVKKLVSWEGWGNQTLYPTSSERCDSHPSEHAQSSPVHVRERKRMQHRTRFLGSFKGTHGLSENSGRSRSPPSAGAGVQPKPLGRPCLNYNSQAPSCLRTPRPSYGRYAPLSGRFLPLLSRPPPPSRPRDRIPGPPCQGWR